MASRAHTELLVALVKDVDSGRFPADVGLDGTRLTATWTVGKVDNRMGLHEAPAFDPGHMAGHAPGSAFGLGGPQVDTAALAGSISTTIMHAIYPPQREAQKVDVHSDVAVQGTVQGKGEVSGRVDVAVQPSRYFEGLVRRAEVAGRMDLRGDVSGTTMGGVNGVEQHPARQGLPAGMSL